MIVLGFDTATPATAIGLRLTDGSAAQARDDPQPGERPGHATRLLPLATKLLAEAGLRFRDLDRIAVGLGPGTFTGLRIGVATARGLAQSLGVELVGVSSLRALAEPALRAAATEIDASGSPDGVLAVIDARRGQAFAAAYALADGSDMNREQVMPWELSAPRAFAPADLGEVLDGASATAGEPLAHWLAVGDGAVLYRNRLEALGVRIPQDSSPLHRVSGEAICEIAVSSAAQVLDAVLPDYRRRPDAEIALEGAASERARV